MRLLLALLLIASPALAQDDPLEERSPGGEEFVSTFSIIGYDPATQELGIGVQSRAFRAGAIVPWAVAGVGAVATQAAANQTYGPRAMELLREGKTPQEVVDLLTSEDPGRDRRQLAIIDPRGRVAAYTGAGLDAIGRYAGHIVGENFSAQGNTLAGPQVVSELARAFRETEGELAERLMAALEAAQAAGGDSRGMQAAGIYIVKPIDGDRTTDKWVDIRVDDADDPFRELRRLMEMSLAGRQADRAEALRTQGKLREAVAAQEKATRMNPRQSGAFFRLAEWHAEAGQDREALNALRRAIGMSPQLRERATSSDAFARLRSGEEFRALIGG